MRSECGPVDDRAVDEQVLPDRPARDHRWSPTYTATRTSAKESHGEGRYSHADAADEAQGEGREAACATSVWFSSSDRSRMIDRDAEQAQSQPDGGRHRRQGRRNGGTPTLTPR